MNLVLIKTEEVQEGGCVVLNDRRARHIIGVLNGKTGQELRVGVLNGYRGTGVIQKIAGSSVALKCEFNEKPMPEPSVDLLLALPRPKVMKRLWAPLASLGVGRIVLTNAEKVERNYFDTHWLDPKHYEPLLIEGLEQAADTRMPKVSIVRRLKPFLEDKLDKLFPTGKRFIAHPGGGAGIGNLRRRSGERVLLAVGPEGGWTDFELDIFAKCGFIRASLGERKLRTDVACIALISALAFSLR